MGKIVVSENVSLDGVIQDPAGDEGFKRGGWVGPIKDRKEVNRLTLEEALSTEILLLGRRSYVGSPPDGHLALARWQTRSTAYPSTSCPRRSRIPSGRTRPS